jgi:hypothetical protein
MMFPANLDPAKKQQTGAEGTMKCWLHLKNGQMWEFSYDRDWDAWRRRTRNKVYVLVHTCRDGWNVLCGGKVVTKHLGCRELEFENGGRWLWLCDYDPREPRE